MYFRCYFAESIIYDPPSPPLLLHIDTHTHSFSLYFAHTYVHMVLWESLPKTLFIHIFIPFTTITVGQILSLYFVGLLLKLFPYKTPWSKSAVSFHVLSFQVCVFVRLKYFTYCVPGGRFCSPYFKPFSAASRPGNVRWHSAAFD